MPEAQPVSKSSASLARVGATLDGKYRLERLLGTGGMASVYEATHRNGKRFAVKILHNELSIQEDTRTRFLREGYVANKVEHPGAVAVIDDHVAQDGAAFLVMELLEGAPIDALALRHGGKLPLRVVLAVAEQTLDVLAAADAKQIVHRDIKPSNLFLTREGQLKVLDFGVARLRGEGYGAFTTHSGVALGTPAYMAPEQALGRASEIDGQSDLWALGATMFALLAGRAVHEAPSAQEQMVLAATKPSPSLGDVNADVPRSVVAIVDKALAFAKSERWATAAEMRDAVRAAHRELFTEDTATRMLATLASEVRVSVVPTTSPSDPMAPTALAEAVPEKRSTPPHARVPTSNAPHATSLVGTAARVTAAPASRTVRVLAASVLIAIGVGAGLLLASQRSGSPRAAASGSTTSSATGASSAPAASATTADTATAATATTATSTGTTASATATPSTTPPTLPATARPKPSTPQPHDSFDRQ